MSSDQFPQKGKQDLATTLQGYRVSDYLDTPLSVAAHNPHHNPEYLICEYVLVKDLDNTKKKCILRQKLLENPVESPTVSLGERFDSDDLLGYEHIIIPADCVNLSLIQSSTSGEIGQSLTIKIEQAQEYLQQHPEVSTEILRFYNTEIAGFAVSLASGKLYLLI